MVKLIVKHLKRMDYIMMVFMIVLIAGSVYLELMIPSFMQEITLLLTVGAPTTSEVMIIGLKMLACALGAGIISIICGYISAKISANLSYYLKDNIYTSVQKFSIAEMKKFSTASLITRTTNDVNQVQMFLSMGIVLLVRAPIMAISAICIIATKNYKWTLATFIAVAIIVSVIVILISLCIKKFKKIQQYNDDLNRVSEENLTGLRVVRAFNAEKFEEEKFEKTNNELTKTHLFIGRTLGFMGPIMNIIMNGLTLAIYAIAIGLMLKVEGSNAKALIFADMTVFSNYAMQIIISFMLLIMIFIMMPRALVSAKRINEVLKEKPSVLDGTINNVDNLGTIEFKNVSFKYPDAEEYVLKNISFKVNKGETVAFIGSTGSGKSTLINLVPRLYDSTEGEVLVDGVNVKEYSINSLNNKIGYISQKATLFNESIKNNLTFGDAGKEIKKEDIEKALLASNANEFVDKFDSKLDYVISQGGNNVSGGQKQRLSIARALAKDPEILIFDDSFSALDMKTDRQVRQNLKKHYNKATTLIVAQRIGTIKNADKIVVLDNGNIVGIGSHESLLKSCKTYREIALSQLSKEEL